MTGPGGAPGSARGLGSAGGLGSGLSALLAAEVPAAIELRHDLHRHAELSGAETRTAAVAAAALGAPDAPPVAGTGRLIRIGPAAGPAIAIRAELDGAADRRGDRRAMVVGDRRDARVRS